MASAFLAEGAPVPVAATAVRAELTRGDGASGASVPAPGVRVAALLLTEGGVVAREEAGTSAEVDLRTLPVDVARVLFPVPAGGRAPGLRLRLLRAGDAAELVSLALPPDTRCGGGELFRADGRWCFRAAPSEEPPGAAADAAVPGPPSGAREPRVPSQGLPPAAESDGGLLPPAVARRLALRREQVAVSLVKYGAAGADVRVVLVLDASGAMALRYLDGAVADVVERTAAVAAVLAGGRMPAWTFASHPARLPDCVLDALPEWLRLHVRAGQLAFLGRPRRRGRGLRPGQIDMRSVGVHNEEHKAIAAVRAYVRQEPAAVPTLVVFVSAGGVHRNAEIERQLAEGVDEPVFWQFVGLGRAADYGVLARLGAQDGELPGNAGFFAVDDITRTSDAELYDRLLCAFPAWLAAARRSGVVD